MKHDNKTKYNIAIYLSKENAATWQSNCNLWQEFKVKLSGYGNFRNSSQNDPFSSEKLSLEKNDIYL